MNSIYKKINLFSICAFLFLFPCFESRASEPLDQDDYGVSRDSLFIYNVNTTVYPSSRIPVCWMPTNSPNAYLQNAVRDEITKTYEASTALHFTGWQTCQLTNFPKGIRINILPGTPRTAPGYAASGQAAGNMNLNFTYETFDPLCVQTWGNESCVRWAASHEFGHAISVEHEQNRPDTPPDCTNWLAQNGHSGLDIAYDTSGAYIPSANPTWDWHSVMNYCNEGGMVYNGNNYGYKLNLIHNNGGVLSSIDAANLQSIYGPNKLSYSTSTGFSTATTGVSFSLINTNRSSSFQQPDLYLISWGTGTTTSGNIEISATSASSGYRTFTTRTALPYGLQSSSATVYGFTMAQITSGNTPDMVWFQPNTSTSKLKMFIQSGSSNWQNLVFANDLPIQSDSLYKFTFSDYDGDGNLDLFAMRMINSTQLEVLILKGPSFSALLAKSDVPFDSGQATNCRWVAGNFYNHTNANGGIDLVCMAMNTSSSSSQINIGSFIAGSNSSNPYSSATNVATPTQILAGDGRYSDFGIWQYDASSGSGKLPGDGIYIGYIDRAATLFPSTDPYKTQIGFLTSPLYF